jgi:hypothetical protein
MSALAIAELVFILAWGLCLLGQVIDPPGSTHDD